MRYEILYACGGFYVDADTICTRPLEDWLFDSSFCAPWENERVRPGLIANTYMYSSVNNPFLREVIKAIQSKRSVTTDDVWKITGPLMLTQCLKNSLSTDYTLWPSHYFLPHHFGGASYSGKGHIFSHHTWGSQT